MGESAVGHNNGECAAYSGYKSVGKILAAAGLSSRPGESISSFASRIAEKPEHERRRYDQRAELT